MFTLNCKGKLISLEKPLVMGIVNVNNSSFYQNSQHHSIQQIVNTVEGMLSAGASIIDIGAQTTKPGSKSIGIEAEIKAVVPAIETIITKHPATIISIDTYHSSVAKAAVQAGACIVNDVSGGLLDSNMIKEVAMLNVPYICMHMKGTPETMQVNPTYSNIVNELMEFFIERLEVCKQAGIKDVILDLGFGFGKTIEHNFSLLKNIEAFTFLNNPILVGISRKSMIYKTLQTTAENALNGTTVLQTVALLNGANILRVHDVKEAIEAVTLISTMQKVVN
jgi:dihydropteroate synthase